MNRNHRFGLSLGVLLALLAGACGASGDCAAGQKGCPCAGQACSAGLVCLDAKCAPEARIALVVDDGRARACEVLVAETGGKVGEVAFDASVTGRWLRQGDKVSAAFVAAKDASIAGGAVAVAYAGADGSKAFEIVKSHCYGASGEELPGVAVHR